MVDSAAIFAAKPDVERSDADVLEERRKIRAGAKRSSMQIGALADILFFVGRRLFNGAQLLALPGRELRFGVLNVFRDIVDEFLESVGTSKAEIAAAIAV